MVQWIQPIQKKLGFQVFDAPNSIYEDSQPTIVIIKSSHLTSRVEHIDVPIHYVHEKYALLTIDPVKFKNTTQTENIVTKSSTCPLL